MIIKEAFEMEGMKAISEIVGITLKKMREYVEPGMSAKELDNYGAKILKSMGAKSAPYETYEFPGWTCICVNEEVAHGIPTADKIFKIGDLINIDVSAEKNNFWSDNGGSFVLGEDIHNHQALVNASKEILIKAIQSIKTGTLISHVGHIIETESKKLGFKVIKNLAGHGVGRSLHEDPQDILNYRDRWNKKKFKKNSTVAIETFISTKSNNTITKKDKWTLIGNRGGFTAQHEHTIVVTDSEPIILTTLNGIWD